MRKDECPPLDRAWTPAEGAAMVEEWRKSGMSASAFVRDRGFGLHRLKYWQSRSEKKADFVVVPFEPQGSGNAEDALTEDSEEAMIEICVRDEVFVRIPIKADRSLIGETIKSVLGGVR